MSTTPKIIWSSAVTDLIESEKSPCVRPKNCSAKMVKAARKRPSISPKAAVSLAARESTSHSSLRLFERRKYLKSLRKETRIEIESKAKPVE